VSYQIVTDDEVVTGVFTDAGVTIGAISAETDDNVITDRSDRYEVQFNISTTGSNVMDGSIEGGDSIQITLTTAPGASTVTELRVPDSLVDRNAVSL
jgi:archaellin